MAKRRKPKTKPWEPFERAYTLHGSEDSVAAYKAMGLDDEIWLNNRYQVNVRRNVEVPEGWPAMIHLSIKRIDKGVIHDWRDLQRIKNEIVGPQHEAVELYPAESRLIDTANQYHLWVMANPDIRFPFGWCERLVSDGGTGGGQRKFKEGDRPEDCKTKEEMDAMLAEIGKGDNT